MEGIFDAVVKVAENHGIKVKPDKLNPAAGDCLFDSIVDNINHRPDDGVTKSSGSQSLRSNTRQQQPSLDTMEKR